MSAIVFKDERYFKKQFLFKLVKEYNQVEGKLVKDYFQ
jgi:hypothetical protein